MFDALALQRRDKAPYMCFHRGGTFLFQLSLRGEEGQWQEQSCRFSVPKPDGSVDIPNSTHRVNQKHLASSWSSALNQRWIHTYTSLPWTNSPATRLLTLNFCNFWTKIRHIGEGERTEMQPLVSLMWLLFLMFACAYRAPLEKFLVGGGLIIIKHWEQCAQQRRINNVWRYHQLQTLEHLGPLHQRPSVDLWRRTAMDCRHRGRWGWCSFIKS